MRQLIRFLASVATSRKLLSRSEIDGRLPLTHPNWVGTRKCLLYD